MKNNLNIKSDKIPYHIRKKFIKLFSELKEKSFTGEELKEWKVRLKQMCKEVEAMGYKVH